MTKCPFFGVCGGCQYDFSAPDYRSRKLHGLPAGIDANGAIWGNVGARRRGDFAFAQNHFGLYRAGSRDIIDISHCPNMVHDINAVLPVLARLPWGGAGSVLVTKCDNGIVVNVSSVVPSFDSSFKVAVQKLPAEIIRFTWNDTVIRSYDVPRVSFDGVDIDFPDGAFLQPTIQTEQVLRDMVMRFVSGRSRVADLFCGLGNFTYATGADGFDITGIGVKRDLFKNPLRVPQLNQYGAVIMDPPRAGALAQSKMLAASNVSRVVYVSCNPMTWRRDRHILECGGYTMTQCVPVDQFVGSLHWEIFSVFDKAPTE